MTVSEMQARRKAAELEPKDWPSYRQALIDSGMVDEARERRSVLVAISSPVVIADPARSAFHYNPRPRPATGPAEQATRTLGDAHWEDKHGVAEDWRQAQVEPEP